MPRIRHQVPTDHISEIRQYCSYMKDDEALAWWMGAPVARVKAVRRSLSAPPREPRASRIEAQPINFDTEALAEVQASTAVLRNRIHALYRREAERLGIPVPLAAAALNLGPAAAIKFYQVAGA